MPVSWIPADPAITSLEASLSAALGQLSVDVAAIPTSPIASIQTGYLAALTMTSGSAGEDRWYRNTTVNSVDTAKTRVYLQAAAAVGTTMATTLLTGRMTSATNLRVSTLDVLDGTPIVVARYYIVEYS